VRYSTLSGAFANASTKIKCIAVFRLYCKSKLSSINTTHTFSVYLQFKTSNQIFCALSKLVLFCIVLVPIFSADLEKQTAAAGGSVQCVRLLLIMRVFIEVIMVQAALFREDGPAGRLAVHAFCAKNCSQIK